MAEYLKIHLEGQKPLVVLLSMKKLEERLPSYFLRIHRSYIVNMKKVMEVTKNRIVMNADHICPLATYTKRLSRHILPTSIWAGSGYSLKFSCPSVSPCKASLNFSQS